MPERKYHVRAQWEVKDLSPEARRKQAAKFKLPRPEFGEDDSRPWWADVSVPAKAMRFPSRVPAHLSAPGATHSYRSPDAPYCKIKRKDFNPGSRQDVVDRFSQVHGWVPTEFTENGTPEVNDGVLKGLTETIPIAKEISECFFLQKTLGQISEGPQSWLNKYNKETRSLHCHINVGGTVSGRCAHSNPNLGQVIAVIEADILKKDGSFNPQVLGDDGQPIEDCWEEFEGFHDGQLKRALKKKIPLKGRTGEYGWEARALFGVHIRNQMEAARRGTSVEEFLARERYWRQVGVDLSGIEFRALAEVCAPFDNGELIQVVLTGDIHAYNMEKTGILNRDIIKRVLYGLLYGAGDYKLGVTADPSLTSNEAAAKALGAELRATLMRGVPALKQAIDRVQRDAQRGYLIGLDGRKLWCRSPHSALNLRLQSDAALIAKRWAVLTEWYALEAGMDHGWNGDFVMMTFVHDELQNAVRHDCEEEFAALSVKAAADAGLDYGWRCPVGAKAKPGFNWAECH